MTNAAPALVIFDVDGTLLDSRASIVAAMTAAYEGVGLVAPSPERIRHIVGLSLKEAVATLSPDLSDSDSGQIADGYRTAYNANHREGRIAEPLYPGIVAALDEIEAAGVLLGVATGKSRPGLDGVLDRHGLNRRFITLQTSDRHPSKPHPAMVLAALRETGADAETTVMIGDTSHDIAMAKAAGTRTLGVTWGFHPAATLRAAGADAVIDDTSMLGATALSLLGLRDGQGPDGQGESA